MPSLFRPGVDLLTQYARYHRDPRNITTHFVGIPLIVFAVGVLLGRPSLGQWGSVAITPAVVLWVLSSAWYLSRRLPFLGFVVSLVNGALIAAASTVTGGSMASWLAWGVGSFVVGWVFQFVGHYYEGRKPAFVDDLVGLLVGPAFVVAEALFSLGWGQGLRAQIEAEAGPTRLRDLAAPAA